jgi:hypothetical protein
MYQTTRILSSIRFGSDGEHLYLRLDPTEPLPGLRVLVTVTGGKTSISWEIDISADGLTLASGGAVAAYQSVLELALPLSGLEISDVPPQVYLRVLHGEVELERIPATGALTFHRAPTGAHWSA